MRKERKHFTPEEKVAILRWHLVDKIPVSGLCEEHGLRPTVFYRWQKEQHGAIDERTSRHPGYAISLSKRWLVEKPFGWLKQIGPLKKVKLRGLAKVAWLFVFSCAAFNLIRIPKLRAQSA